MNEGQYFFLQQNRGMKNNLHMSYVYRLDYQQLFGSLEIEN